MRLINKLLFVAALIGAAFFGWYLRTTEISEKVEIITNKVTPTPLTKYEIENLAKANLSGGEFKLSEELADSDTFTSYLFEFIFDADLDDNTKPKTTTGLINIPKQEGPFPLVVMFRGYVDTTIYQTGVGTRNAGEFFARNGYITIAPDFLGYAGSDENAANIFESRFQTYTLAISLINSIGNSSFTKMTNQEWNKEDVFIWAHSNGGQIALTTLEATGKAYPTTLWAPVSKSFPYSVLYYTDEAEDKGKFIRHELAKFEDLYDTDKYSLDNYFELVKAPVQIHQGGADDAIPVSWSEALVYNLKEKAKVQVDYHLYSEADHNMRGNWDDAVARDIEFFELNKANQEN